MCNIVHQFTLNAFFKSSHETHQHKGFNKHVFNCIALNMIGVIIQLTDAYDNAITCANYHAAS